MDRIKCPIFSTMLYKFVRETRKRDSSQYTTDQKRLCVLYHEEIPLNYQPDFNESLCAYKAYWAVYDIIFLFTRILPEKIKSRPKNSTFFPCFNTIFWGEFFTLELWNTKYWTFFVRKFLLYLAQSSHSVAKRSQVKLHRKNNKYPNLRDLVSPSWRNFL